MISFTQLPFSPVLAAPTGAGIDNLGRSVSIHAPARGATSLRLSATTEYPVSIHAPARGATPESLPAAQGATFQSTPPREGRPRSAGGGLGIIPVSIHAPARGATLWAQPVITPNLSFNPRPRARGDGVWPRSAVECRGFNPRPRARGDMPSW